jgi:type I restriction enzyme S subunit
MGALPILIPPAALQNEFASAAEVNNQLKDRLTRQNQKLSEARDLLLPRLMDGRISA